MKSLKYIFSLILIFSYLQFTYINISADNLTIYGEYTVGHLTFTSYAESWNTDKLKELYLELLNNFHGDEFNYLKEVTIFPDSPYGVNGHYIDDIYIKDGAYTCGENAIIRIFNGNKLNTLEKIAPILSHEYGHHYTIYNMLKYENVYLNNYETSEYYKIRNLSKYPVTLNYTNEYEYSYHWDIPEILANDYVQLLGSSRARQSTDFKDLEEMARENLPAPDFYTNAFNSLPQSNPYLPLASEVSGLYTYLLKISGYTSYKQDLSTYPEIIEVTANKTITGNTTFKVKWSEAVGVGTLEYTVVMYPTGNPFSVIPIKTVSATEELSAVFGSFAIQKDDGSIYSINHPYLDEIVLKVYVKDAKGYVYSSEPVIYNLSELSENLYSPYSNIELPNLKTQPTNSNITETTSKENTKTNLNFNIPYPYYRKNENFILSSSISSIINSIKPIS